MSEMIEETNVEQVKSAEYPEEIKNLLAKSALNQDDDSEVNKAASYFRFKSDLDTTNFTPFGVCGHYQFDNPPVLTMKDGFTFVLTPELLSKILFKIAKNRHAMSMHSSQIGLNFDFFIVRNPKLPTDYVGGEPAYETFINSTLVGLSDASETKTEIMSSYPGIYLNIERPYWADIKFKDINGEENRERVVSDWCRYFIQNYCLSRGKPFWEFASPLKRKMALKKRNKKLAKAYHINRLI